MQVVDGRGTIGYSRQLTVATPAAVNRRGRRTLSAAGEVHAGIEDSFKGKASSVWYWTGAQWVRLSGSD